PTIDVNCHVGVRLRGEYGCRRTIDACDRSFAARHGCGCQAMIFSRRDGAAVSGFLCRSVSRIVKSLDALDLAEQRWCPPAPNRTTDSQSPSRMFQLMSFREVIQLCTSRARWRLDP